MSGDSFENEGFALMGAAFEVHATIGGGMAEEIYQESLEIELGIRSIPFESKAPLRAIYKGQPLRKEYFPDLMVNGEIVTELKAVSKLLPEHEAQLLNYLRITGKRVGYLINFGPLAKLEWKRFVI
ncbi:MAG: GxxExxY protein [Verrucomicrobiae bacterium]